MTVGNDASAAGYPLVPNTGDEGRVRFGAREINRTRDLVAQVKKQVVNVWPVSKGGTGGTTKATAREGLGIRSGTTNPTGGSDGDIYLKILL